MDRTGLTGHYAFTLNYTSAPRPDSDVPSVFTALEEQLGLKLRNRGLDLWHRLPVSHSPGSTARFPDSALRTAASTGSGRTLAPTNARPLWLVPIES